MIEQLDIQARKALLSVRDLAAKQERTRLLFQSVATNLYLTEVRILDDLQGDLQKVTTFNAGPPFASPVPINGAEQPRWSTFLGINAPHGLLPDDYRPVIKEQLKTVISQANALNVRTPKPMSKLWLLAPIVIALGSKS